jgi:hypothetical protein
MPQKEYVFFRMGRRTSGDVVRVSPVRLDWLPTVTPFTTAVFLLLLQELALSAEFCTFHGRSRVFVCSASCLNLNLVLPLQAPRPPGRE